LESHDARNTEKVWQNLLEKPNFPPTFSILLLLLIIVYQPLTLYPSPLDKGRGERVS